MEFTRKDKLWIPLAVLKDNSMQPLQMFLRSDLESKERRRKQKGPSNAMGRGTPQIIFILPNSPDGRWDSCPKPYRGAKLRTAQNPETVQDYRRPPVPMTEGGGATVLIDVTWSVTWTVENNGRSYFAFEMLFAPQKYPEDDWTGEEDAEAEKGDAEEL